LADQVAVGTLIQQTREEFLELIDLRSDTVTKPTSAMRRAMAEAPVGDDVYGEDPTVNRLQDRIAALLGKEAGLFVPSGSMGNLIALYLQAGRGGEVLAHEQSHIIHFELASGAALAGCQIVPVPGPRGVLRPEVLGRFVRGTGYANARTKLVEIENTGNLAGGTCYAADELKAVREWASQRSLAVHMDGARLWNASVAQGEEPSALAAHADTVSVCFSKGLGAPVGSALVGTKPFIAEALRIRKMLGGGMRQAGILAAAALYALDHHIETLADDHLHARMLAEALETSGWARVPVRPETNIVFAETPGRDASTVADLLAVQGLQCSALSSDRIRFVTHLDVSKAQTDRACEILRTLY
jgi:threonine aldolase